MQQSKNKLKKESKLGHRVGIIILVIFLLFIIIKGNNQDSHLEEHKATTYGQFIKYAREVKYNLHLVYRYNVKGKEYIGEVSVGSFFDKSTLQKDSIYVEYDSLYPNISRIIIDGEIYATPLEIKVF